MRLSSQVKATILQHEDVAAAAVRFCKTYNMARAESVVTPPYVQALSDTASWMHMQTEREFALFGLETAVV
eukprot:3449906-Rhodomonas_salina.3